MRDGIHSKWIADQPNGSLKFRVTNDFVTEITVKKYQKHTSSTT